VDDLPLLIQDRQFEDGRLVLPGGMMVAMQGRRGDTILVNGAVNPSAVVPNRLVRLRLVNASNAGSTNYRSAISAAFTGSAPKAAC
jgi:FtsP/CotA-like multicopper oxidase with cupredoxin domain